MRRTGAPPAQSPHEIVGHHKILVWIVAIAVCGRGDRTHDRSLVEGADALGHFCRHDLVAPFATDSHQLSLTQTGAECSIDRNPANAIAIGEVVAIVAFRFLETVL